MSSNLIFLPPSFPMGEADPYWDKVIFLSHFDAVTSADFVDLKGHNINSQVGTSVVANSRFGSYAAKVTNATIEIPLNENEVLHTDDFTLEAFVYGVPTAPAVGYGHLFAFGQNNQSNIAMASTESGYISLGINGQTKRLNDAKTFRRSVWNHVALCRHAGTLYLWLNGELVGSVANNLDLIGTSLVIAKNGGAHVNSGRANFTFDEVRLTKGVARYTEAFSVPTEPFSNF